jgi:hypothetical protein
VSRLPEISATYNTTSMLFAVRLLSLAAMIAPCAAWHLPHSGMPVMRSAMRASIPSMGVAWAEAPAEAKWAEAAWIDMNLHSVDLGEECIFIPDKYGTPDNTHNWYFCSSAAKRDSGINCIPLPMLTEGRRVSLRARGTSRGSRPVSMLTALPRPHRCSSAQRPNLAVLPTPSELGLARAPNVHGLDDIVAAPNQGAHKGLASGWQWGIHNTGRAPDQADAMGAEPEGRSTDQY